MGNCEKCNKKVYEKSLIFINDKFICLQCDDEHEETLKEKILNFLKTDPSNEEGEKFYLNEIFPHDKRSISEILKEEK